VGIRNRRQLKFVSSRLWDTPPGKAITPEQQRIQSLERQVNRLEMEKAILTKAATLLAEDSLPAIR